MMLVQLLPVLLDPLLISIVLIVPEQFLEVALTQKASLVIFPVTKFVVCPLRIAQHWIVFGGVLHLPSAFLVLQGPLLVGLVLHLSLLLAHHALLLLSMQLLQVHVHRVVAVLVGGGGVLSRRVVNIVHDGVMVHLNALGHV